MTILKRVLIIAFIIIIFVLFVVVLLLPNPTAGPHVETTGFDFRAKNSYNAILTKYRLDEDISFVEIPENINLDKKNYVVTDIGTSFLKGSGNIETFVIPPTIKRIYSNAFHVNQVYIKKLTVPSTVEKIDDNAFNYAAIIEILFEVNFKTMNRLMFFNSPILKKIVFTGEIEEFGELTFWGCDALVKVILPKTLKTIGKSAFAGCFSLTTLILPPKVEKIGYMGLGDALTELTFEGEIPPKFETDEKTGDAYILDKVKTVYIPLGYREIYQEQLSVNFPNAEFIETK